jgi:uncharacterized protein YfaA (DUF2138 family)
MNEALPFDQESAFRSAIDTHLTSGFKKLSSLDSFGFSMPNTVNEKESTWLQLKVYDL